MTHPFGGITRIRFIGYDLRPAPTARPAHWDIGHPVVSETCDGTFRSTPLPALSTGTPQRAALRRARCAGLAASHFRERTVPESQDSADNLNSGDVRISFVIRQ